MAVEWENGASNLSVAWIIFGQKKSDFFSTEFAVMLWRGFRVIDV